jgi:hypothetical protein
VSGPSTPGRATARQGRGKEIADADASSHVHIDLVFEKGLARLRTASEEPAG